MLPVPAGTLTVPAGSFAASNGFYGAVPVTVSPTMVGTHSVSVAQRPIPAGNHRGQGPIPTDLRL